jgi:hypothetical protein
MSHTFPNNNHDNYVADGADPTPEEARLMAEGLDPVNEAEDAEQASARIAKEAADAKAAADAVAEAAEAAKAAAEAADPAAIKAAAEAAATAALQAELAKAPPAAITVPDLPTAPATVDFEAQRAALKAEYEAGTLNAIDLADKRDEIIRAETAHMLAMDAYGRQKAAHESALAQQAAATTQTWNTTAVQWEAEHADFLANPMRHADMQRALALETTAAREKGEQLTFRQLLDRAGATAMAYSGYTAPVAKDAKDPKAVQDAIAARKAAEAGRTLGDVPNAGQPGVGAGNDTFAKLDNLGIVDLEEAVQNMTPKQLEEYLRDSPGSNSRGRAPAEADEA